MKFTTEKDSDIVRIWLYQDYDGEVLVKASNGIVERNILSFKDGQFKRFKAAAMSGLITNREGKITENIDIDEDK